MVKQSNGLEFFYDHTGVVAVKYNGNMYFYRKDVQGNIVAIVDSSGWLMVEYNYDAWGRHTCFDESTINLGVANPFRYRGYYYDVETGLYFLKTRYYDPEIGRFMSIDGIEYLDPETINGLNLYAYCNNNPVMNIDPNGTWSWKKFWKGVGGWLAVGIGTVLSVVAIAAGTIISGGSLALLGGILIGAGSGFFFSAGLNIIDQGVSTNWNWDKMNPIETLKVGGIGSAVGAVSGVASGYIGSVFETSGKIFGYFLGKSTIGGLNVAKAFSSLGGIGILTKVFAFMGKTVGAFIGAMVANEYANQWFGKNPTNEENVQDAVKGAFWDNVFSGIYNIFKWS
ncbi:MAG: hypothetical protein IJV83_03820 [Clostridia bacterium]|nr:hypothetical protein [Clostridia bacterium]